MRAATDRQLEIKEWATILKGKILGRRVQHTVHSQNGVCIPKSTKIKIQKDSSQQQPRVTWWKKTEGTAMETSSLRAQQWRPRT